MYAKKRRKTLWKEMEELSLFFFKNILWVAEKRHEWKWEIWFAPPKLLYKDLLLCTVKIDLRLFNFFLWWISQTNLLHQVNRSSRRKRGIASNPLFIMPDFFCIFPMNFAMATLGLKEMGKFLWEGRKKSLTSWPSQFSFAKLRQPTGQTFFPTFPKKFSHFLQT